MRCSRNGVTAFRAPIVVRAAEVVAAGDALARRAAQAKSSVAPHQRAGCSGERRACQHDEPRRRLDDGKAPAVAGFPVEHKPETKAQPGRTAARQQLKGLGRGSESPDVKYGRGGAQVSYLGASRVCRGVELPGADAQIEDLIHVSMSVDRTPLQRDLSGCPKRRCPERRDRKREQQTHREKQLQEAALHPVHDTAPDELTKGEHASSSG